MSSILDRFPASLLSTPWLVLALILAGCGGTPATIVCDPVCPKDTHCTETGCVADNAPADIGVVMDKDMTVMGCPSPCGGATPYCNANKMCVGCLRDDNCPAGQICKTVGATATCAPGCADDSRCKLPDGGVSAMRCCAGHCIDTSKDALNCGACANACGS